MVTLNNEHPISANADDKRRSKSAVKVNKTNCKFGKARNLEVRKKNYYKTFGKENVNFIPIASLIDVDMAEKVVLQQLRQYKITSPSGRKTEWMAGIQYKKVIELAFNTLKSSNVRFMELTVS